MLKNIVIRSVCDFYEVTKKELISDSRKDQIVWARHTVVYQLRVRLKKRRAKLWWIAQQVGVSYSSTVWHSIKVYGERIETDMQFKIDMKNLNDWIEEDVEAEYKKRFNLQTNT